MLKPPAAVVTALPATAPEALSACTVTPASAPLVPFTVPVTTPIAATWAPSGDTWTTATAVTAVSAKNSLIGSPPFYASRLVTRANLRRSFALSLTIPMAVRPGNLEVVRCGVRRSGRAGPRWRVARLERSRPRRVACNVGLSRSWHPPPGPLQYHLNRGTKVAGGGP